MTNENFLVRGTTKWFQPTGRSADDLDSRIQNRLAFLVGLVALCLPFVMVAGAAIGETCFRDSISHYYYAPFLGSVFVGFLIFIGGFLIAYTGEHWMEDAGSFIAGIGACFVAIFPTSGNGCGGLSPLKYRAFVDVDLGPPIAVSPDPEGGLFQLFPNVADLHVTAALTVFLYLGLYCLIVMKRVVPGRHVCDGTLIETKKNRNILYSVCGYAILFSVAMIAAMVIFATPEIKSWWNGHKLTFLFESIALWAFGIAWFAKGRRFARLNDPIPTAAG